jgi:hypothetical protein
MDGLVRLLPIAPWARTPVAVLAFVVLLVMFAGWLPLALLRVYENWQRLVSRVRGSCSPTQDHQISHKTARDNLTPSRRIP